MCVCGVTPIGILKNQVQPCSVQRKKLEVCRFNPSLLPRHSN